MKKADRICMDHAKRLSAVHWPGSLQTMQHLIPQPLLHRMEKGLGDEVYTA